MQNEEAAKRPGSAKKHKTAQLKIDRDTIIEPAEPIPPGSRFKGYRDFVVQELTIESCNTRYRLTRWQTPDGQTLIGQLPKAVGGGHFGPALVSYVLYQHYHCHVTQPLLCEQLREWGIEISAGQVNTLLQEGKEQFHAEKDGLLSTGLALSAYVTVDDTGTRHQGRSGYVTHIGNPHFAWFKSTDSKSRSNFLELLRAGHGDYQINEDALAYMKKQKLSQVFLDALRQHESTSFTDQEAWQHHLDCLGMNPMLSDVPPPIIDRVRTVLRSRPLSRAAILRYDQLGTRIRHQKLLRAYLNIQPIEAEESAWLLELACEEAQTKAELPDIVNVLIEELVRRRYELPPLTTLQRIAAQARNAVNETIYQAITGSLDGALIARIDALLAVTTGKSGWEDLKQEPRRPTTRAIASFLKHIDEIRKLAEGLPTPPSMLSASKRMQLVTEARALDVAELRSLKTAKRYALAVLFIQAQLQKAPDDVAEIFIKVMRKYEPYAKAKLQKYHLDHADAREGLVGHFREVLQILQDEGVPEPQRLPRIHQALSDPAAVLAQCNEHIAYAGNFDLPFMLAPYRNQRSLLFQCLDVLPLQSSSQDRSVLIALAWLQGFRTAHREYLLLTDNDIANLPLNWMPQKWERAIFPHGRDSRMLHRRFFELCVLHQIMRELNSGELYVEGSDRFDDYRIHQVSDEEFRRELPRYCEIVGLPLDSKTFVKKLRERLDTALDKTDAYFQENDSIEFGENGLIIHKPGKEPEPPNRALIDQAITASMLQISILDLLTETEQWLNLHKLFGPLSGFDAKIDEPRKRFISTLFCYGCNLGPSQTARSVKGLSRKQVAWLKLKHITEERLDKAIVKAINAYNQFALPKFWRSGKRSSADGTKWNLYEQNLLSEYHVRYGGYGGIGYYHVSDMYIALFSHFIPCGVHEAVYILDGLIQNGADIKPDTIHGDTQAQSGPDLFGMWNTHISVYVPSYGLFP